MGGMEMESTLESRKKFILSGKCGGVSACYFFLLLLLLLLLSSSHPTARAGKTQLLR